MITLPIDVSPAEIGHAFHEALEKHAPWIEPHPDDPAHDEVVGHTVRAALSGQMERAVTDYNAWAAGAGYANLTLLPGNRIDIQECVLRIVDGGFEIEPPTTKGVEPVTDPDIIDVPGLEPPIPDNWGIHSLMLGWRVWGGDGYQFMLVPQEDGTAEVHTRLRPGVSMIRAVRAGREVIRREMEAGCRLVGRTPKTLPQIYRFALACGMVLVSETADEWYTSAVEGT